MAVNATKDPKTKKWYIQFRYTDWTGQTKKSCKRGFSTKRAAEEWYANFLSKQNADITMTFGDLVDIYFSDLGTRLRENTLRNKHYLVDLKILPYFKEKRICDITAVDIRKWQAELMAQNFKPTYLRSIQNQITAIFNYAVKYYNLPHNPCHKAGGMGKNKAEEMNFWTTDEFNVFIKCIADNPMSYAIFNTFFWCGLRLGELLALTPSDIDFIEKTLRINKSYQRLGTEDVITEPKTPKSKRVISLPEFLCKILKEYIDKLYSIDDNNRLFQTNKSFITRELKRGCELSGVKHIRIHDLRHSHCALLLEMGIPPLEVAERLGHEKVETTMEVYAHIYPDKQRKLSDKLQTLYQNMKEDINDGQ